MLSAVSQNGNRQSQANSANGPNEATGVAIDVLIIEDDMADFELTSTHLKRAYPASRVLHATDMASGIELLSRNNVGVVLLDYQLPDNVIGPSYIHEMRGVARDCHLPIIVLTGMSSEDKILEAFREGASDYISKRNISAPTLYRAISNAAEKARLKRDNEASHAIIVQNNHDLSLQKHHISSFYQTVSHELKSPLTGAREYVSLVMDGVCGDVSSQQRELLQHAINCCDSLKELIHDLLDTAAMENGKFRLKCSDVDLEQLVRSCIARYRLIAKRADLAITIDVADELPLVQCDRLRVDQLLSNLVGNAIKYGTGPGKVAISLQHCANRTGVDIAVSDTGQGIDHQEIHRIFDKFYQVEEDLLQHKPGMGLGLYLCQSIAELHNGEITVTSTFGEGSCFRVFLPLTHVTNINEGIA